MLCFTEDSSAEFATPRTSVAPEHSPEFEALATPLFDSLYNFARWLSGNSHDAEDLVQETYLKGLRHFDSFRPGGNFKAWMFQILRNTHYTTFAKSHRRTSIPIDDENDIPPPSGHSSDAEQALIQRVELTNLRRAIDQLPPNFRDVVQLRDTHDISYRQIASILSIPTGTVMSRLARGRRMIRQALLGLYTGAIDEPF